MHNVNILKNLPPIQQAIARLNLDTLDWLTAAGVRRLTIDRVDRATMRASLAVELAQDGSKKASNLRRARDAMITYLNQVRFLCLHGQLAAELFDEAERRVEQIREGLADLEGVELAKWPKLKLRSLRPPRALEISPPSAVAPSDGDSSRPGLLAQGSLEESARSTPLVELPLPENPDSDGLSCGPVNDAPDEEGGERGADDSGDEERSAEDYRLASEEAKDNRG
jgi:hypothetical protein